MKAHDKVTVWKCKLDRDSHGSLHQYEVAERLLSRAIRGSIQNPGSWLSPSASRAFVRSATDVG